MLLSRAAIQQRAGDLGGVPWLYPFKGIYFFATHPFLYPLIRGRLLPCTLLSLFVLGTLFTWTYLPQVAFFAIFHGKAGAWLNATFLVLGEGAAITALLFEAFFVDEAMVDVFDAVFVYHGYEDLVETTRPVNNNSDNPVIRLEKPHHASVYSPFSLRQIIEFIVLLPLSFVPWIGVPLFLWLTGYRAGPFQHWRYFNLRELTNAQRDAEIKSRQLQYTSFGCVTLLLQLIPGLSMLFLLTSACGSALWASKLENRRRQGLELTPDAAPPDYAEYEDDSV